MRGDYSNAKRPHGFFFRKCEILAPDTEALTDTTPLIEKRPHLIRRLYDWVLHWADTPYGGLALFLLAFAESSFFPIPPDVLLIALAISIPKKSLRFAAICTAGSVVGGLAGYGIGALLWSGVQHIFIPHIFSQAAFEHVVGLYQKYDFWVIFTAAFTPIPYKVITITAGVCHVNLVMFVIASTVGRAARFFLVGMLFRIFGKPIRGFIESYFNLLSILFTVLLIGGFFLIRYWHAVAQFLKALF